MKTSTRYLSASAWSSGGYTLTIGGDQYGWFSEPAVGGSTITTGGDPYGWFSQPATVGSTITIGGDPYGLSSQQTTGGYTLTIPGTPLYEPGEEEALRAIWEHHLPLSQFLPLGIGVNMNPPFMPNLVLMGDVMNAMSYNHMLDPMGGTPSHYNYYTHERVFFT